MRQACEWDEMLSGLEGDEREVRLIELARFEHLTPIERSIYCSNGGMAEKEEPPAPVRAWKKVVAYAVLFGLVVYPCFFLLLFGIMQGKAETKLWFIDAMVIINLEVWVFEPLSIFLLCVFPTQLIRHKVKVLTNPTHNARFPYKAQLHEYPTTYLSKKYSGLVVARHFLKHRAMITRDGEDGDSGDGASMLARFFGVADTAVQAPLGSRAFFSFRVLSFVLLMPGEVQAIFVDDFVKGLFAAIAICSQIAGDMTWAEFIGTGVGILAFFGVIGSYCCCYHKELPSAKNDSDDEEDDDIEEFQGHEHEQAMRAVVLRF